MRICAPWSVSSPRVSGAWLRSDGSFEYQFLIDNTVYRYFKYIIGNGDNSAMPVFCLCSRYCELQILYAQSRYRSEQKSIKNVGKISCGCSHAVTPKNFQSTHILGYWAHRAVIFAIARLSCLTFKRSDSRKRILTWNSHSRSFKVIHFAISYRPTRGSMSPYNISCRISEVFEDVAT